MPRDNKRKKAGKQNQKLAVVKVQVTNNKLSEGIATTGAVQEEPVRNSFVILYVYLILNCI